jgi:hypothetical protein
LDVLHLGLYRLQFLNFSLYFPSHLVLQQQEILLNSQNFLELLLVSRKIKRIFKKQSWFKHYFALNTLLFNHWSENSLRYMKIIIEFKILIITIQLINWYLKQLTHSTVCVMDAGDLKNNFVKSSPFKIKFHSQIDFLQGNHTYLNLIYKV